MSEKKKLESFIAEWALTRTHIACENDKGRAALDIIEQNLCIRMKFLRPGARASRIDQNAQHLGQTLFSLVDADEAVEATASIEVGKIQPTIEQLAEDDLLGFRTFSVTAEGMTQALMRVDLTKTARLEGVSGKPVVYVDYLEVAPWNQSFAGTQKKYRGAGPILLTAAVELSFEEGFKGRLGLHSLPQAESYYEKEGMIDLGPDALVQNLRYYEMTSDVAQTLLVQE